MFRLRSLLVTILLSASLFGQEPNLLEKIPVPDFIDTLFIDRDINNWSIRLFMYSKEQRFNLSNQNQKIVYAPNNPGGIGFGLATRKVILDIGFNTNLKRDEPTDRIDVQATFLLNNHYFNGFIQAYKGFNVRNELVIEDNFRKDMGSTSSGINYMYMFNADKYSVSAMKSGLSKQKRTAISYGLGGFLFINKMSADSSIIPVELQAYFNEQAYIIHLFGVGGGVHGGFNLTIPFLKNFFVSASAKPGIGLFFTRVETESDSYKPSNPLLYHLHLGSVIGYNGAKCYVNVSIEMGINGTNLDFGNYAFFNTTNAKLALGYKLNTKH